MNNLGFRLMALVFKVRDVLSPPSAKVAEAGIQPGDHVLDYACGPGSYALAAAQLVGETGKVYAADIHPLAGRFVERKARRAKLANVQTIQTDCDTGLADATIDVVLLYDTFHGFDQPAPILAELHRVLKPDGRLSFSDHHMAEPDILSQVQSTGLFQSQGKGQRTYTFVRVSP